MKLQSDPFQFHSEDDIDSFKRVLLRPLRLSTLAEFIRCVTSPVVRIVAVEPDTRGTLYTLVLEAAGDDVFSFMVDRPDSKVPGWTANERRRYRTASLTRLEVDPSSTLESRLQAFVGSLKRGSVDERLEQI